MSPTLLCSIKPFSSPSSSKPVQFDTVCRSGVGKGWGGCVVMQSHLHTKECERIVAFITSLFHCLLYSCAVVYLYIYMYIIIWQLWCVGMMIE